MNIVDCLPRREGDVVVRPLAHADAAAYAAGTEDPAVRRYGHLPYAQYTPQSVRDMVDHEIARGLADNSLAVLAIADAASDEFLGSVVLFDVNADRAEVGFWLTPAARGRGAAQQGLRAVASIAADAGLGRLDARADWVNEASRGVLESVGFVETEGPHDELAPSGETVTVLTFELRLVGGRTA
ncbi:GNAT family N-acetyltransferase [[Mycobacterium] wendilense]|uniref:GNAT family N-acetyltransferase n=1 Tax=[Mycobacterium] wendilense TaxID=3064284 RepID=A0ABM9MAQ4_9MYCO|nr:GNAT family N-acetyltransferase [Mycolicibacterium sp. MU0050]CAJ1580502.1 GNAT family N-acetyltransferase [Mycolicibacterium sp. MU0050]